MLFLLAPSLAPRLPYLYLLALSSFLHPPPPPFDLGRKMTQTLLLRTLVPTLVLLPMPTPESKTHRR